VEVDYSGQMGATPQPLNGFETNNFSWAPHVAIPCANRCTQARLVILGWDPLGCGRLRSR